MRDRKPNRYQQAVLDWIRDGRGNAIVNAVAGSGKTTLLVMAARTIAALQGDAARDGIMLCFNAHIAKELNAKLAGTPIKARTLNSLGHRAVMQQYPNAKLDPKKYRDLIYASYTAARAGGLDGYDLVRQERRALNQHMPVGATGRLLDLARASRRAQPSALREVMGHFDVEIPEDLEDLAVFIVRRALEEGWRQRQKVIDYGDQIWIPLNQNLPIPQFDWVFIDECQDLSPSLIALATRVRDPQGRAIAVGDPFQSIMGFAGADADSFHEVKGRLQAQEFPLSVCYRCPTSHIEKARQYVAQIEARPGADGGLFGRANQLMLVKTAAKGDLVLSRKTAPLISTCYRLIAAGISAGVRGREVGQHLLKALGQLEPAVAPDLSDFPEQLAKWYGMRRARIERRSGDHTARLQALEDTMLCFESLFYSGAQLKRFADLSALLRRLFENDRPDVVLSTIHRAKGLEADRVWILEPDDLESPTTPPTTWHIQQEKNVAYVAYTRAKQALYEVRE